MRWVSIASSQSRRICPISTVSLMSNRLTFKAVDVPAGGAWRLDKSEVEITYPGYDERIKDLAAFYTKFGKILLLKSAPPRATSPTAPPTTGSALFLPNPDQSPEPC